jgi:hypothetical protein
VKLAAGVAGDNEVESFGKCAATRSGIAGEGGQDFSSVQVPQPYRVVIRNAEAARCTSDITATSQAPLVWLVRVRSSHSLSKSHTFSVLSAKAETAGRPSPLTATSRTSSEWSCGGQLATCLQLPDHQCFVPSEMKYLVVKHWCPSPDFRNTFRCDAGVEFSHCGTPETSGIRRHCRCRQRRSIPP